MAYSRTTPGQVAAQIAAGAAVLGIVYHSFYGKREEPKPTLQGELPVAATSAGAASTPSPSLVAALEKEAANTAGKYWAQQRQQAEQEAGGRTHS